LLFEAVTDLPVCLMEGGWITAVKTGASTAVTAKYLARTDSKTGCIFGAGRQGRSYLEGLSQILDLAEARIVDALPEAAAQYAKEMSARPRVRRRDHPLYRPGHLGRIRGDLAARLSQSGRTGVGSPAACILGQVTYSVTFG